MTAYERREDAFAHLKRRASERADVRWSASVQASPHWGRRTRTSPPSHISDDGMLEVRGAMAFKLIESAQARWRGQRTPPGRPRPLA